MEYWVRRKRTRHKSRPRIRPSGAERHRGGSIANAKAILQGAVKRAVIRGESPVRVRLEDFQRAAALVNGA